MNKTRRSLLCALGTSAISIPLSTIIGSGVVLAADITKLNPEDPAAKKLEYVHKSPNVSRRCAGCQFFTGVAGTEWGSCIIFPDKYVNAAGVCNSWYAKAV